MINFLTVISVILGLCTFAIILSVLISFFEDRPKEIRKETKSIVETGSMFVFFLIYYLVIKYNVGSLNILTGSLRTVIIIIGTFIVVLGTYVNIKGRSELGQDWANQIKIYKHHNFHKTGMFSIVRHPLYASLIWIFFGGGLIFQNYLALLLNICLFIPFMYYRAKQEELLLISTFPQYTLYQQTVYMFFPKIFK